MAARGGGKFLLYGSAASGCLRYDSDVDILVDFDAEIASEAVDFVETLCARLNLIADVQPKSWCKPGFIAKIAPTVCEIP